MEDELGLEDYFEEGDDIVSIGGLIYSKLGKIPVENEKIEYKDLTLTVEKMQGNRIERVKVCLR